MSIWTGIRKIFSLPQRKGLTIIRTVSADVAEALRTYENSVGNGMGSDVIMSPVLWAARRMAESPVAVKRLKDEELDFGHDAARLLKRPNPFYSGSALKIAATVDFLLDGNVYLLKIRNKQRKPVQLWYIPHWLMEPHIPEGTGYIDWYDYYPNGIMGRAGAAHVRMPPEDVVHLRDGIDPANIRKGLSRLKILLREIYTDDEAAMFTAMLLKNGGVPGVIISPADSSAQIGLPGEDLETSKKRFEQSFNGAKRGKPMFATGPTKVEQFGFDPQKLDLSRLREIPEERVTALLGIPAAVVGFGTGLQQTKVGATMSEMRAMAYEDCIIPMQMLWSDEFDLQLLPDFEESPELFRTVFDLSGVRVLRDDETKLSDRILRQLSGGLITRAMALGKLGYEATPDDEVRYISIVTQIVPVGELPPAEPVPPKGLPAPLKAKQRASPGVARLMHAMRRDWEKLSNRWTAEMKRAFTHYGDEAATIAERLTKERGMKAEPDWERMGYDLIDELSALDLGYEPHFLAVGRATFGTINAILNLGVDLSAPAELRLISLGGIRKGLVDLQKQTRDAVFQAIEEGRAAGEGAAGIVELIREMVPKGPWASAETRSIVIARTETKYAQNMSSLEAYRESENVTGIQVFDAQLGPTDEECEMLNGQVVSVDEAARLAESEHPNGTRSFAPVVGEPKARKVPALAGGNGGGRI